MTVAEACRKAEGLVRLGAPAWQVLPIWSHGRLVRYVTSERRLVNWDEVLCCVAHADGAVEFLPADKLYVEETVAEAEAARMTKRNQG